ncbi:hypothetical protein M0R89_03635 [Halorussus limi]|uniref:Uncharacterized protein n=1 Tax=Halorussus limi TaxID=2938695 RepID=A0A8U0HW74_9EURY|nr:hypothetical protein [Halorussus limi]UPV75167.1 hypothetical protein M0R89_03635 [Halorussus limi]
MSLGPSLVVAVVSTAAIRRGSVWLEDAAFVCWLLLETASVTSLAR